MDLKTVDRLMGIELDNIKWKGAHHFQLPIFFVAKLNKCISRKVKQLDAVGLMLLWI